MDSGETDARVIGGVGENASSDEIKATIDQTRDRMDQTLEELGERLHPRHLLDDVLDYFRHSSHENAQKLRRAALNTATKCGRGLLHQIREHPLPSLLVGAGLVWMAMENKEKEYRGKRFRSRNYSPEGASAVFPYEEEEMYEAEVEMEVEMNTDTDMDMDMNMDSSDDGHQDHSPGMLESAKEKAKEKGRQMKEKLVSSAEAARSTAAAAGERISSTARSVREAAAHQAQRLKETTQELGSTVRERAHDIGDKVKGRAQQVYHRSEEQFLEVKENHPVALGAGFMALGLIVGLLLPRTRAENALLGDKADALREQARQRGEELYETGKKAAVAAVNAATTEAEQQGITTHTIGEKVGKIAQEVKQAALESARREGLDAESLKQKAQQIGQEAKNAAKSEVSAAGGSGNTPAAGAGSDLGRAGSAPASLPGSGSSTSFKPTPGACP